VIDADHIVAVILGGNIQEKIGNDTEKHSINEKFLRCIFIYITEE